MKITWEVVDIVPGRIVGRAERNERWMVGYTTTPERNINGLVSLSDGMFIPSSSKAALAEQLTERNELPAEILDSKWSKR